MSAKSMPIKKHYELPISGIKKVIKESILQVKEVVTQYELKNVPAFNLKNNLGKSPFRIEYELLGTNFSD